MTVLLDHVLESSLFLFSDNCSIKLHHPRIATIAAVAAVTPGHIACHFHIYCSWDFFCFLSKCNLSELTVSNHQRQMFA